MSRIGRIPVAIPDKVNVVQEGGTLSVQGPSGTLSLAIPSDLSVSIQAPAEGGPGGRHVVVQRASDLKPVKALHGLYRAMIANMVRGVTEGFIKELEILGVGYRAQVQGQSLALHVGFSHPVMVPIPQGITVQTPKPTSVVVKGMDKQLVGQVAANIRRVAPPEPYKGKGIKYAGEVIRRKAGKAATGAKGGGAGGGGAG
ncbi:MAG: 50S ribosomal protein L6 [Candidatus Omnitrophica bacterium]|nr:50S ribosomal protein L6 [Candidatus Omnitrophota bacterium]